MSDWANSLLDRATKSLPRLDLEALANVPQEKFRQFLEALPAEDRDQVRTWARAAAEVRGNHGLSREQKQDRIRALDTTATLLGLMRALLDAVASRAPEAHRGLVRGGLGVAAVAAAGLNFELTGLAAIALRLGLPAFVLSDAGGKFCDFVLASDLPSEDQTRHG